jgi:hypothetical protein
MRFAMIKRLYKVVTFAALVPATMFAQPAFAESAFIAQAGKGAYFEPQLAAHHAMAPLPTPSSPSFGGPTQAAPETAAASGGNRAGTLEMGKYNSVFQAQAGAGNVSNVGILHGMHDNVDVLQHGQGLMSNLLLVNVQGLSVDVIQPPGSGPVNMLIARLPNGTLDVIQPKGSAPVKFASLPNGGLLLIKR